MSNKSKLSIYLGSSAGPFPRFILKVMMGIVIGFAIHNYIVREDGKVFIDWPVYVVGVGALLVLYLISDVWEEYRRKLEGSDASGRQRRRKRPQA